MKMRAVLIGGQTSSEIPGGTERFTDLLMGAFPGVKLITPERSAIPNWPFLREPAKSFAATKALDQEKTIPDVVLYNGMYGWALPRQINYKKIALCHGTYTSFAQNALKWSLDRVRNEFIYAFFERKSLANADLIIANSRDTQARLKNDYGLDSTVIPLGIDVKALRSTKQAREKLGLPRDKKIVLFVGRPTHGKGFDIVSAIAAARHNVHVVTLTHPRASAPFVDGRGPFPFAEVAKYLAACDVIVFPSRYESFGYVTLEALAAGKPVITTPFGVAKEINHPSLRVVNDITPDAFLSALDEVLAKKNTPIPLAQLAAYDIPAFKKAYQSLLSERSS